MELQRYLLEESPAYLKVLKLIKECPNFESFDRTFPPPLHLLVEHEVRILLWGAKADAISSGA